MSRWEIKNGGPSRATKRHYQGKHRRQPRSGQKGPKKS